MKKYIILTYVIGNMGGAQIYCLNKILYCKKQEYTTFLFPSEYREKIYIHELEEYNSNIKTELSYSPSCFPQKTIDRITEWFLEKINYCEDDEIIIESHTIQTAQWGELLAKKVSGTNFVFLLSENVSSYNIDEVEFLRFKKSINQLACINKKVMKKLFPEMSVDQCVGLGAVCGNSVQDVSIPEKWSSIGKDNVAIGILGRLNKPYVRAGLEAIVKFSINHKEQNFDVLIIGGSRDESDKIILMETVKNYSNIHLHLTDYLYPIPQGLIRKLDVCIAGAGSSRAVCEFVPTISVDVYDMMAIGVLGYNTSEALISNIKKETIESYLEKIIYGNFLDEFSFYLDNSAYSEENTNKLFEEHFRFIEISEKKKDYYSSNFLSTKKAFIYKLLYIIGGVGLLDKIKNSRRKRRNAHE